MSGEGGPPGKEAGDISKLLGKARIQGKAPILGNLGISQFLIVSNSFYTIFQNFPSFHLTFVISFYVHSIHPFPTFFPIPLRALGRRALCVRLLRGIFFHRVMYLSS